MRTNVARILTALLLCVPVFAQNAAAQGPDRGALAAFGEKAAIAAVNFHEGDMAGFTHARADFTPDGWKGFVQHMQGFLGPKGEPTFTSSFVASGSATVLDEKDGVLHLRIPGTLTQSSKLGRTTYRAALDVYVLADPSTGGKSFKIQRLDQVTCGASSKGCS
jgi:hypothetical protein